MGGSATDQWVQQWAESIARWSAQTAGEAVKSLLQVFGPATEPSFGTISPAYNRMLAIALLVAGAFVVFALLEKILGGTKGAGWEVLPRTLVACMAAFAALGVVEYAAYYANLLASAWNQDFFGASALLAGKVDAIYSAPITGRQALGSAAGMFLVCFLTTLLALLIYIELILRAALVLVSTTFLPFMCVMAIWPRMAGVLRHLVEFIVALLFSKFVIATAVYVGFSLVAHGFAGDRPGQDAPNALITGLATLMVAAFSPLILLQGIRITDASASNLVRTWGGGAARAATGAAGFGLGAYISRASAPIGQRVSRLSARRRRQSPAGGQT
jgi:hypothetical protein